MLRFLSPGLLLGACLLVWAPAVVAAEPSARVPVDSVQLRAGQLADYLQGALVLSPQQHQAVRSCTYHYLRQRDELIRQQNSSAAVGRLQDCYTEVLGTVLEPGQFSALLWLWQHD